MSEGLEALKELRYRITNFNGKFNDYNKIMNTIEQELKALEIIKKHPMFSLHDDLPQGTYKMYDCELYSSYDLTQEEYNLLKEVLR